MSNEARPIDHSTGSAIATTAGGTLWGGFKWGLLLTAAWVIGLTALGAWALPAVFAATGAWQIGLGIVGGLFGFGVGTTFGLTSAAVVGTAGGAIAGGLGASNRVSREREAAQQMQQEIAMAQSGQGRYAIDASSAEYQGKLAQMERSRAQ